uniref:Transglutaminase-like domain-containing protein n=1 Tax=Methanococcus maripaludis (strain C6 / ATCC BAA-1332) TaxID=444158 RepID=A9A9T6_METM6
MNLKLKNIIYIAIVGILAVSTLFFIQNNSEISNLSDIFENIGFGETSEKLPKYIFEDSIEVYLSPHELEKVSNLAQSLNGNTIEDSIWNIILWEEDNIEYSHVKAELPTPEVTYWITGKKEVSDPYNNTIQSPAETLKLKSGICGDYALLTSALLLKMDYSPIYILTFESNGNPGHAAAAVNLNGNYYIIDQQPPIMDLYNYLDYKSDVEDYSIDNITFYKIELINDSVYYENGFEAVGYYNAASNEYSDIPGLSRYLMTYFEQNYELKSDYNIKYLDSREYLPRAYEKGVTIQYFFEFGGYTPIFEKQYAKWAFDYIKDDMDKSNYDISEYNSIWIRSSYDGKKLNLVINLAKK